MSSRSMRAGVTAAGTLVAAASLVFVAGAAATTTVSNTTTASGSHSATVFCPAGTHVVSGGGVTPAIGFLYESEKRLNGWVVSADPNGNATPFSLTVRAYCSQHDLNLTAVHRKQNAFSSIATCDSGTSVVSGGGLITPNGFLFNQFEYGNGWEASGDDFGTPQTMKAYAYCTPGSFIVTPKTEVGTTSEVNGTSTITAGCPSGTKIASGGGSADGSGYLFEDQKAGNGWIASAQATNGGVTSVTAYAYCK